jgi:hypothetical protein
VLGPGQHRQQWMMRLLSCSVAVVPLARAFLLPIPFENRRVQIEHVLLKVTQHQRVRKPLQHRVEIFGLRLTEREKKPPHCVFAPKPLRSGDSTHNLVMENPLHVREAVATHQDRR